MYTLTQEIIQLISKKGRKDCFQTLVSGFLCSDIHKKIEIKNKLKFH